MTVRTLLQFVQCPIELRCGRPHTFTRIKSSKVYDHRNEEVTEIVPKGRKLIIYAEVPSYELDNEGIIDDLPWEQEITGLPCF